MLELCLAHGARLAEPGEFTKRAFLNGRIDLAQAEAVGELIRSKNETARRASMAKLSGRASEDISGLRGEILYEMAFIEAAMDDPEHISIEGCTERLLGELSGWQSRIQTVLDGSRRGRLLTDGIRTAIIGRPNVGKSSIMNLLLGEDRAIVTQVAGTTRDTLEEQMSWEGISLNIIDTAGIRETDDPVELIGVERARKALEEADLVLLVADASEGIGPEDRALEQTAAGRPAIAILNKTDLLPRADDAAFSWGSEENGGPVMFSAVNGTGLEELKDRIKEMFFAGTFSGIESSWLANARQTEALEAARESLEHVREAARAGLPEDMFTIDLSEAYRQLGLIIGEDVDEDLINKIFSDFCMGK